MEMEESLVGHIDQEHMRIWRAQGYRETQEFMRTGAGGPIRNPHPPMCVAHGEWARGAQQAVDDIRSMVWLRDQPEVRP